MTASCCGRVDRRLLGGWMPAPSTLGTFLRAFTFGHVRQLDALLGETLARAWQAGAGPGDGRLVIDVDSFIGEVRGHSSRAPPTATPSCSATTRSSPRAPTPARCCTSACARDRRTRQKGMLRFIEELIARVERAGADGVKLLRADSGFWNNKLIARLERAGWQYSIGVRIQQGIREAVEAIAEDAWQTIDDYPDDGEAQIAETTLRRQAADRPPHPTGRRAGRAVARLAPLRVHHQPHRRRSTLVEAEHRDHAVVELMIRDLKDQALAHFPSGEFNANGAWTVIAALAHNLLRWTQLIGLPDTTVRAARTLRRRCSRSPAGSPATAAPGRFTSPPAGPGKATTSTRSNGYARSQWPSDHHRRAHSNQATLRPFGRRQRRPKQSQARPSTSCQHRRHPAARTTAQKHGEHGRSSSNQPTRFASRWIRA